MCVCVCGHVNRCAHWLLGGHKRFWIGFEPALGHLSSALMIRHTHVSAIALRPLTPVSYLRKSYILFQAKLSYYNGFVSLILATSSLLYSVCFSYTLVLRIHVTCTWISRARSLRHVSTLSREKQPPKSQRITKISFPLYTLHTYTLYTRVYIRRFVRVSAFSDVKTQ